MKPFNRRLIPVSLLIPYILFVLTVTVFSRSTLNDQYSLFNFDISSAWAKGPGIYGAFDTYAEMIMNILLLLPFGYLLARITSGKKWIVFSGCLLFTLSIETLQLLTRRGFFELADILLNMSGGVIGYMIWRMFSGQTKKT